MRIFITGATGFLGSYVARELLNRSHDIAVLTRSETSPWRIKDILSGIKVIHGDLTRCDLWAADLKSFNPDAVIHTAWQGVQSKDYNSAIQTENLIALQSLFALMHTTDCRHFIGTGSQAEYGVHDKALDETAATNPLMAYAKTKLAAQAWCQAQCMQANIRFAWLRVFTIYGPRDNPYWLIPSLINSFMNHESPALTLCEQMWDFLYVTDAAAAFADVLEQSHAAGIFNLGSNAAVPLLHVATALRDLIAPELELGVGKIPYRENQIMHLEAKIQRLTNAVGWKPTVSLMHGLQKTVAWHKANINSATAQTTPS